MNTKLLPQLLDALKDVLPEVKATIHSGGKGLTTWIDLRYKDKYLVLEFRPALGFGLHIVEGDDCYGEGPDETYRAIDPLLTRITALFKARQN